MSAKPLPTPEYLRECMDYDQSSGALTWKRRPSSHFKAQRDCDAWNTRMAGRPAGVVKPTGRVELTIDEGKHRAHRVAWTIATGAWPNGIIDHIDGNPNNNAFANLREGSRSQNGMNLAVKAGKIYSGLKGVTTTGVGKFKAQIRLDGKQTYLGTFDTEDEAHIAYCRAAYKRDGAFANFGEFLPTTTAVPLKEAARHAHKFLSIVAPNEPATIRLGEVLAAQP